MGWESGTIGTAPLSPPVQKKLLQMPMWKDRSLSTVQSAGSPEIWSCIWSWQGLCQLYSWWHRNTKMKLKILTLFCMWILWSHRKGLLSVVVNVVNHVFVSSSYLHHFSCFLILIFTLPHLRSPNLIPSSSTCPVEANEGAWAGEGLPAHGPGGGGAGPGLVPGPNPQRHRETAAGRPEHPLHGQYADDTHV